MFNWFRPTCICLIHGQIQIIRQLTEPLHWKFIKSDICFFYCRICSFSHYSQHLSQYRIDLLIGSITHALCVCVCFIELIILFNNPVCIIRFTDKTNRQTIYQATVLHFNWKKNLAIETHSLGIPSAVNEHFFMVDNNLRIDHHHHHHCAGMAATCRAYKIATFSVRIADASEYVHS